MPLVSVLMTVYNAGEYLRPAIDSILAQSYQDFEFLIINDGSTDESLEVLQSYEDPRIRIHNNPQNIGQTASLNVGLNLAKGKYIARIDADDVAFPNWLESQMEFLARNPDCAVVSANAIVIDEANRVKRSLLSSNSMSDMIFRSLTASPINHGVSLMDKNIVLENGGYDPQYKIISDYGLWSKLIHNGCQLTSNSDYLMAIRMHSSRSSISSGNDAYIREFAKIMKINIENVSNHELEQIEVELLARAYYSTETLNDIDFEKAVSVLEKIYQNLKPEINTKKDIAYKWLHKQRLSFYLKRIYLCIERRESSKARDVSFQGRKKCGNNIYFFVFIVASFLGGSLLAAIPLFYEKFSRQKLRLKLLGKQCMGMFC